MRLLGDTAKLSNRFIHSPLQEMEEKTIEFRAIEQEPAKVRLLQLLISATAFSTKPNLQ
jgi:hypothetical protein